MFRRSVDSLIDTMLLAALLPLVLLSAFYGPVRQKRIGTSRSRRHTRANTPAKIPIPNEFDFAHAVEAYEALIDSVLAEHRA